MSRTVVPSLGTGRARVSAIFWYFGAGDRHDCATTGTSRAKAFVIFGFFVAELRHGPATTGTGRASLSGQGSQKISSFSHHIRTKTYKTNENNIKQRKTKELNLWVASHEALV